MIKKIFIVCSILFANSFLCFPQAKPTHNTQEIIDNDIEIPKELESNFDVLLSEWRTKMKDFDINCDFDPDKLYTYPDSIYINRIYNMPNQMELVYNQVVRSYIDMYAGRRKSSVPIFLAKSNYYFPIFERFLDQYQIPLELKYLPIIESALNPTIVSRAGATGLWQFMIGTGRMYDLEINSLVDERRDPVKSSEAAARYLRDLYNIYGDWILVIAAYNCGPGNVNKAIKRSGGATDYWQIYNYLPRETRGYVPAFIAANYIMNYPEEHGICPAEYEYEFSIDTIHVNQQLNLNQVAEALDMPIEDLRDLNTQYKKDIIPGNHKEYVLRLPSLKAIDFIAKKDQILGDSEKYISHRKVVEPASSETTTTNTASFTSTKVRYKVKRGDNLSSIAKKNRTTVRQIKRWNNLKSDRISIGQYLVVGVKQTKKKVAPQPQKSKETAKNNQVSTVNKPDNDVVEESSSNLLSNYFAQVRESYEEQNNETDDQVKDEDETIVVDSLSNVVEEETQPARDDLYVHNTIYHKVRIGETLKQIATKYNVKEKDLKKWNKLKSSKLEIGERLVIYLPNKK